MKYPIIKIKYNRFLDPIFKGWILSQEKYKNWTPPDMVKINSQVLMYKEEWGKYGEKIIESMCRVTNLEFERNIIDIYIVSGNPRPFSRPLVLSCGYNNIKFINYITHELIHCLFSDNDIKEGFSKKVRYTHDSEIVSRHVLVYAILNYILIDVLEKPNYLENVIKNDAHFPKLGYHEAWNIIEKIGYKKIIELYKEGVLDKVE